MGDTLMPQINEKSLSGFCVDEYNLILYQSNRKARSGQVSLISLKTYKPTSLYEELYKSSDYSSAGPALWLLNSLFKKDLNKKKVWLGHYSKPMPQFPTKKIVRGEISRPYSATCQYPARLKAVWILEEVLLVWCSFWVNFLGFGPQRQYD
ncbi:hypothetical protein DUI87_15873 [Hirundo rustica rustica]|uniref:Uncharacterized protein n=1 Tax=Hirundo rustica rustica TaxID=333673 RepID=A0A3M0JZN2_HIRRU|nr:hypothetical protein DUI87_15873 [Hirundo rustica rustica]